MEEFLNKKIFISIKTDDGVILKFREVLVKEITPTHITFLDLNKNKIKTYRKEDIQEAYEI